MQGKYNEMEELRHQEESRQQRISRAKEDLTAAEAELTNLPPYEPPKHKIVGLTFFTDLYISGNASWVEAVV